MKVTTNLKTYKWQDDVIYNLRNHRKGCIHTICARRQVGKSILVELLLLETAINNSKTTSFVVSPTLEQSRKIFKELKDVVISSKIYKKHNEVQLSLEIINGSRIICKSAAQDENLRGFTCTGILCIDEAAYISDEIFYTILPWTNVSQCPIILTSTPAHKTGFFYDYYCRGWENGNNCYSYKWSDEYYDMSELLPKEKLEEYRKQLPPNQFKTEYMAEFLSNEGSVFGDYSQIINEAIDLNGEYYVGIDWASGSGQDDTAICIFNSKKQMIALYHFNDRDETQTIKEIINICKRFNPKRIQVEINSIGSIFYGLLSKALKENKIDTQLIKFTTTNSSKEKIINNFQVAIQNREVQILNDEYLKLQLDMYEMKLSSTNKRIYNAASGYHDDCLIATLLAFDCINKGKYILG